MLAERVYKTIIESGHGVIKVNESNDCLRPSFELP